MEAMGSAAPYRLYTNAEYLNAFAYNSDGTNFNPESLLEIFNTSTDNQARSSLGYNYQNAGYASYCATKSFQDLIQSDPADVRNGMISMITKTEGERPFLIKYNGPDINTFAYANNYPLIRLSEVYLIAAEAAVKGSSAANKTKGLTYLNAIVSRGNPANSVSDANYTLERVLEERRKELIGEGHRYFDLLRNGITFKREEGGFHYRQAINIGDINWDFYLSILGVPFSEFRLNPQMKELQQQNPGYNYE
jgi:hypothetical protein